jgi:hypothetical protein
MHPRVRLALLILAATGCSRAAQAPSDREIVYRAETTITVRVVNHSQLDAVIYLVHDGGRDRLGTATAASTASFPVRTRGLGSGEFTLLADPLGALRATSTEVLLASQGSVFTWTLESDFSRGGVLVQE